MVRKSVQIVLCISILSIANPSSDAHKKPNVSHSTTAAGTSHTPAPQLNPNQVLAKLLKGNERFVDGFSVFPHHDQATRTKTATEGQKPIVSILSCSDSRVPLESIFDMGIGDLFVIRVAGNVADPSEIGSLEYGVGHLGTPLIMVLGHTKCGAVTAVVKGDKVGGNILSLIDNIQPAVQSAKTNFKNSSPDEILYQAIKANVWQSIEDILKRSSEIRNLVKEGNIKIVGAMYDIESGKVTSLGVHNRQEQILREAAERYRR
jgi:carbonic anhydrase